MREQIVVCSHSNHPLAKRRTRDWPSVLLIDKVLNGRLVLPRIALLGLRQRVIPCMLVLINQITNCCLEVLRVDGLRLTRNGALHMREGLHLMFIF